MNIDNEMSMKQTVSHQFTVDQHQCIRCGECVNDCPVNILVIGDSTPFVADGRSDDCIGCQHCLAICPEGAVSVLGLRPADSLRLDRGAYPTFDQLDRLFRGRRSVRRYIDEDVDPDTLRRLLAAAAYAPSGRNDRRLSFSVVDNRESMSRIREQCFDGLSNLVSANELPPGFEFFVDIVNGWKM